MPNYNDYSKIYRCMTKVFKILTTHIRDVDTANNRGSTPISGHCEEINCSSPNLHEIIHLSD